MDPFGLTRSDNFGESWENLSKIDLTITSIVADSQNDEIYVGGFSSGGFQEVYKIPYDMNIYEMIGTNKGLK